MVASVLLDNPSILFLDEPTTGLDSYMALSLMNSLKKLASGGRTIITTLHQPSSKIFNMLDMVIFLGDGKLAYMGPPKEVLTFFDSIGYVCPDDHNPADYIIDILAINRHSGEEQVCTDRVRQISKAFTKSELTKDFNANLAIFEGFGACPKAKRKKTSFWTQFSLILRRSFIDNRRNPALARAKFIQKSVMGIFCGLLYFQTRLDDYGIGNINGALFYSDAEASGIFSDWFYALCSPPTANKQ